MDSRSTRRRWPAAGALVLVLAVAVAAGARQGADEGRGELPPSPAERAWAAVGADTPPAAGGDAFAPWPAADDPAWSEPAAWERWAAALRALVAAEVEAGADPAPSSDRATGGERPRAAREHALARRDALRVELALCALAQGRHDDAWAHFAAVREPALLARLLPSFLPGATSAHPALPGGAPAPLAEGAALCPALPPAPPEEAGWRAREMRSAPFGVGGARVAMRVYFEPGSGVQVDLEHLEGEPVRLAVRLPVPPGTALGKSYRDWEEVANEGGLVTLALAPGGESVSLWANHRPEPPLFPREEVERLPGALARAGVCVAEGAPPRLALFGRTLAQVLGVSLEAGPSEVAEPASLGEALAPLVLTPASDARWTVLVGALERFALERRNR